MSASMYGNDCAVCFLELVEDTLLSTHCAACNSHMHTKCLTISADMTALTKGGYICPMCTVPFESEEAFMCMKTSKAEMHRLLHEYNNNESQSNHIILKQRYDESVERYLNHYTHFMRLMGRC